MPEASSASTTPLIKSTPPDRPVIMGLSIRELNTDFTVANGYAFSMSATLSSLESSYPRYSWVLNGSRKSRLVIMSPSCHSELPPSSPLLRALQLICAPLLPSACKSAFSSLSFGSLTFTTPVAAAAVNMAIIPTPLKPRPKSEATCLCRATSISFPAFASFMREIASPTLLTTPVE